MVKFVVRLLAPIFLAYNVSGQLTITPGSQLAATGNIQLTLQNTDFVNDGNFAPGNGAIIFSGNASSNISGSQPIQFFELAINKSNNASLVLQRAIGVSERVFFSSGFLNLNGFNTDLGTTGLLQNEREESHVTGANGGQVLLSTILNAPTFENPGNLGAIISSSQNLGNVIIKRGHQSQTGIGLGSSTLRYYDIIPSNNANVNAILQINYLDAELNGVDENSLVFFKSVDGINWSNQGVTIRNTITNLIDKNQIGSFGRWTLSSGLNSPLPLVFLFFNAKCDDRRVLITWKTAQEQNTSYFNIERSTDGIRWSVIGSLPAAGNSFDERSYSFADNQPAQNNHYRVAEYDLDGKVQYTNILRSACGTIDAFSFWPNPVRDKVFINIIASHESRATIKVFDSKGALIKIQAADVLNGSNQLMIDIGSLANGIYSLTTEWNNGQMKKTIQVMKR